MRFDGKTLLITGGTGSFGDAVVSRFLHSEICEIRIAFSQHCICPRFAAR